MPSTSIEALTVSHGGPPVLDRVSLDVERGEMDALLGQQLQQDDTPARSRPSSRPP
jgi:ABC-type branched-subunit amino acid transport system ATPase component